jgi:superfamily II DNA or RNA helicase
MGATYGGRVHSDLWPHQRDAVDAVQVQMRGAGRATVVAACGTGKTRTAAAVAQQLPVQRILVVVPTLELLAQTIHAYRLAYPDPAWGRIIAVCSDKGITRRQEIDLRAEQAEVTTDPEVLVSLTAGPGRCTVFTTYASLATVVANAHAAHDLPPWGLAVVDEAHRTAGEHGRAWSAVHDDARVPARRRLYLTATPRVIIANPGVEARLASMDDESVFGPIVHQMPFARAIDLGLLADYRVLVSVVAEPQVRDLLSRHPCLEVNGRRVDASTVAAQIALLRAVDEYGLRRVVTFHSRVARAAHFAATLSHTAGLLNYRPDRLWATHLSAAHQPSRRREVLERLCSGHEHVTVVANARLLSEGIDMPAVDAVVFGDPRGSTIDAIQAVGRALRRGDQPDKTATIILPVLTSPGQDPDLLDVRSPYAGVWEVLRALRAHDQRAADALDDLRRQRHRPDPGDRDVALPGWLRADGVALPERFVDAITIAAVDVTDVYEQQWARHIAAAADYRSRYGHLRVPQRWITPDRVPLGAWINTQRVNRSRGRLPGHRVAALDALGMVWDVRDDQWSTGYAAAAAYAEAHGHLHPLSEHVTSDGFRLGQWLRNQRRRAATLTPDRIELLHRIDPDWNPPWPGDWQRGILHARRHYADHGDLRIVQRFQAADGYPLGQWVYDQRKRFNRLTREQQEALKAVGVLPDMPVRQRRWQEGLTAAADYVARHGHLCVPTGYVDDAGFRLGQWLRNVRRRHARGEVAPGRWAQLVRLGMCDESQDS